MIVSTARGGGHVVDLLLGNIERAVTVIDPVFLNTPQYEDDLLNARLGRRVVVKLETANPIRSFKGRGVGFALADAPGDGTAVCASSGNFGQAVAWVARQRGMRSLVFAPEPVNAGKRARMEAFGATVVPSGMDGNACRVAAREYAADHADAVLLEDGRLATIGEGAGTIGLELDRVGELDAIVLPIGDGSLITGVARWLKHQRPGLRVIGVNPADAPAMHASVNAGRPVTVTPATSFAEGIVVPQPYAESLERVRELVDEVVLVSDAELRRSMTLIADQLGVLAEPAAAAGLAVIARGDVAGARVATVVTGANPSAAARSAAAAALG